MTLTIQQVVADAKILVSKLKESTDKTEELITKSRQLHKEIDAMSSYREDNSEPLPATSSDLFVPENAQIRALERENKELRYTIMEQQNGLEMIMSKYRQDITNLINRSKLDLISMNHGNSHSKMFDQAVQINEMARVMRDAALVDDEEFLKHERLLQELITENQGLKELVRISAENGSLNIDDIQSALSTNQNTVKRKVKSEN